MEMPEPINVYTEQAARIVNKWLASLPYGPIYEMHKMDLIRSIEEAIMAQKGTMGTLKSISVKLERHSQFNTAKISVQVEIDGAEKPYGWETVFGHRPDDLMSLARYYANIGLSEIERAYNNRDAFPSFKQNYHVLP